MKSHDCTTNGFAIYGGTYPTVFSSRRYEKAGILVAEIESEVESIRHQNEELLKWRIMG